MMQSVTYNCPIERSIGKRQQFRIHFHAAECGVADARRFDGHRRQIRHRHQCDLALKKVGFIAVAAAHRQNGLSMKRSPDHLHHRAHPVSVQGGDKRIAIVRLSRLTGAIVLTFVVLHLAYFLLLHWMFPERISGSLRYSFSLLRLDNAGTLEAGPTRTLLAGHWDSRDGIPQTSEGRRN